MMKIGVPVSTSKTQYYINYAYIQYLSESKLIPVMLCPETPAKEGIELVDGLLLPGGIDLDPIYYGEDNYSSFAVDPEKDKFERALFHEARERGKPIFGICRGFQLIAREYLNSFEDMKQFLYFCSHIQKHNQVEELSMGRNIHQHFVEYVPKLLYGEESRDVYRLPVNSMHHQCLIANFKKPGIVSINNFRMSAWTQRGLKIEKNNHNVVCEALVIANWKSPVMAVQWHPEELKDYKLIRNFFYGVKQELVQCHTT